METSAQVWKPPALGAGPEAPAIGRVRKAPPSGGSGRPVGIPRGRKCVRAVEWGGVGKGGCMCACVCVWVTVCGERGWRVWCLCVCV